MQGELARFPGPLNAVMVPEYTLRFGLLLATGEELPVLLKQKGWCLAAGGGSSVGAERRRSALTGRPAAASGRPRPPASRERGLARSVVWRLDAGE